MNDHVFDWLWYRGRGSARVELSYDGNPWDNWRKWQKRWHYRFDTSNLWFGPFTSKMDALLDAAHRCHRSGIDMQWHPERI